MATLKEIRNRLKSIKSTQQLTKAMKMVAASKLRKAQDRTLNARPYANKLIEILGNVSKVVDPVEFPLLYKRKETKNILIFSVASDRGLCGAFNTNILKLAKSIAEKDYKDYLSNGKLSFFCAGRKSVDFFKKRDFLVKESYPGIFSNLQSEIAIEISNNLANLFLSHKVDKVIIVYNKFKNVLAPELISETLLPISIPQVESHDHIPQYIYEPSSAEIINELLPRFLSMKIWTSLIESNAAEEAARMAAMDSATENAKELLRTLGISYNRARQAAITKELIEIVSGANALEVNN